MGRRTFLNYTPWNCGAGIAGRSERSGQFVITGAPGNNGSKVSGILLTEAEGTVVARNPENCRIW
jgi:hypothetical protein